MYREGKKCVIYSRVSTEMQVDGYSLEAQKNSVRRYALREEMIIVDEYEDAGKSGKSIEGRPSFKKMILDIKENMDIDYIICYKLSRFGRNAADILNSLDIIQSYEVNLICIDEGIDSSQASGRLLISVLSAVAEIERENILEQTMNGRREKARQGRWNGGFAPYGYYLKDNHLYINEYEAKAIQIIFDKYTNEGLGYQAIAKYLNTHGIVKTIRHNISCQLWSANTMRRILENPVYCGDIAYGRRTTKRVKGTKNQYRIVSSNNYIREKGIHEAIVSRDLFERTQAKLKSKSHKAQLHKQRSDIHLFTGILRCPKCGGPMYTNRNTWRLKNGMEKRYEFYLCSRASNQRGIPCDWKQTIERESIENLIKKAIGKVAKDDYYNSLIVPQIGETLDINNVIKEIEIYAEELHEIEINKNRLEEQMDTMPLDAPHRERKLKDLETRYNNLYDKMLNTEEKIKELEKRKSAIESRTITIQNFHKILKDFADSYDNLDDSEKKSVISTLIDKVEIYTVEESSVPLKSITFNYPICFNPLDDESNNKSITDRHDNVESVVSLTLKRATNYAKNRNR